MLLLGAICGTLSAGNLGSQRGGVAHRLQTA